VLAKTLKKPPDGTTRWSVRRLAVATGISSSTVHRSGAITSSNRIRSRSFQFPKDPQLIEKRIDVVGLCLDPPQARSPARATRATAIRSSSRS